MVRIVKPSEVVFAEDKLEREFYSLDDSDDLKKNLKRAIEDIKQNAFCAIPVPKRLIPRVYIQKYKITNLWKYDLPDGWRLLYSLTTPNKVEIISVLIEWFDHKNYDKKFGY